MKRKPGNRWGLVLLCCVLAVPTVGYILGLYGPEPDLQTLRPALAVGALLGLAHLILRPVLRFIFAPVGCLTLGLFGLVIDVGLIYFCASAVEGFSVPGPLYAVLTALLINAVCAFAAGRS